MKFHLYLLVYCYVVLGVHAQGPTEIESLKEQVQALEAEIKVLKKALTLQPGAEQDNVFMQMLDDETEELRKIIRKNAESILTVHDLSVKNRDLEQRCAAQQESINRLIAELAPLKVDALAAKQKTDPSYVSMPTDRPAAQTTTPARSEILFDSWPGNQGLGQLTITNGTNSFAVVKVIDRRTMAKILSAVVLPNDIMPVHGFPDGDFDMIFAFGDRLVAGTDSIHEPHGFAKFDSSFKFSTNPGIKGTDYTTFSITLNPVIGGNARTSKISAEEFNRF